MQAAIRIVDWLVATFGGTALLFGISALLAFLWQWKLKDADQKPGSWFYNRECLSVSSSRLLLTIIGIVLLVIGILFWTL